MEDNDAVIKMCIKERNTSLRHVARTHRVNLDWLFERLNRDPAVFIKSLGTKEQSPDILTKGSLFKGLPSKLTVWNSHGDCLAKLPKGFKSLAQTENSDFASIENPSKKFFGLQFHPEVEHSEKGKDIIRNFLFTVCKCSGDWDMDDFTLSAVEDIKRRVGKRRVILGLSGGVDSSVAAALIHRAIGDQLTCIFVDNGLLRLNEREQVKELFHNHILGKLKVALAGNWFLTKLKGVTDPERKRKIIGKTFIEVFDKEVKKLGQVDFLAQGTLYPDVLDRVGNVYTTHLNQYAIQRTYNINGLLTRLGGKDLCVPAPIK